MQKKINNSSKKILKEREENKFGFVLIILQFEFWHLEKI